jgi:hypothetical protein
MQQTLFASHWSNSMTDNHPIRPPHELVQQWVSLACENEGYETWQDLATQAARWGADQELEACCEWVESEIGRKEWAAELRTARRPEPLSLKEQALEAMSRCDRSAWCEKMEFDLAIIRTALESLPD